MIHWENLFKKEYIASIISGLLLTAAFPNVSLYGLVWIALIPLLWANENTSLKMSFRLGWLTGFTFIYTLIYFLHQLFKFNQGIILCTPLLAAYCGLFYGGAMVVYRRITVHYPKLSWIIFPMVWVSMEYVRGLGILAFPWGWLGYTQMAVSPLLQLSAYTGILGLSFLIALVNISLYWIIRQWIQKQPLKIGILYPTYFTLFLLAVTLYLGYNRLSVTPSHSSLRVGIVQGNIPQETKWDETKDKANFDKYLRLSQQAIDQGAQLVVWPETAMADFFLFRDDYQQGVKNLAIKNKVPIYAGTIWGDEKSYYNSMLLIEPNGQFKQIYHKGNLLPFGEYLPLEGLFPFFKKLPMAPNHFSSGTIQNLIHFSTTSAHEINLGTLICFESTLPRLAISLANKNADILTITTNDSWFGKTSAPYEHRDIARIRAIESGLPVIRAANTGYSCFIDPKGKELSGLDIYREGILVDDIPLYKIKTLYSKTGDILPLLCGILTALFLALTFHVNKKKSERI